MPVLYKTVTLYFISDSFLDRGLSVTLPFQTVLLGAKTFSSSCNSGGKSRMTTVEQEKNRVLMSLKVHKSEKDHFRSHLDIMHVGRYLCVA